MLCFFYVLLIFYSNVLTWKKAKIKLFLKLCVHSLFFSKRNLTEKIYSHKIWNNFIVAQKCLFLCNCSFSKWYHTSCVMVIFVITFTCSGSWPGIWFHSCWRGMDISSAGKRVRLEWHPPQISYCWCPAGSCNKWTIFTVHYYFM